MGWFGVGFGGFFLTSQCVSLTLCSSPTPRTREAPGHRQRGTAHQRQREEAAQAAHHLLQPAAASSQPAFPANPVPGAAGACRAGGPVGAHPDPGTIPHQGRRGWSQFPGDAPHEGSCAHRRSGSDSGLRLRHDDAGVQLEPCRALPCRGGGAGAGGPPGLGFGAPLLAPPSGTGTFPAPKPGWRPGRARRWAALGRGTG